MSKYEVITRAYYLETGDPAGLPSTRIIDSEVDRAYDGVTNVDEVKEMCIKLLNLHQDPLHRIIFRVDSIRILEERI